MHVLGLTGSLGTGKSSVAKMFAVAGAKVLDADKMAHRLMRRGEKCFGPIVRYFGKGILRQGEVDRKRLSKIVFRSPQQLKVLCRIIHPAVVKEVKAKIAEYRRKKTIPMVVIDAPLLFEAGLDSLADYVVVVKANQKLQMARVILRAGISKQEVLRRIRAQMSIKEKLRLADIVIDNRGNLNETQKQVEEICRRLSRRKTRR